MKIFKNGYFIEKEYDISIFEDSKQLARDRFKLQTKGIPIKDIYYTVGSLYITLRVDLRNMNQIKDVGVEILHGKGA